MHKFIGIITFLFPFSAILISCQQPLLTGQLIAVPSPSITLTSNGTSGLTIYSITPTSDSRTTPTSTATITAKGFTEGGTVSVYLGPTQCTLANLSTDSNTKTQTITCTIQPSTAGGLATLLVINGDGTGTSVTNAFYYSN